MKKLNFIVEVSGWDLQEVLQLPNNVFDLEAKVTYSEDSGFEILSVNVKLEKTVNKSGGSWSVPFGPFLLERYARYINLSLPEQHELVSHIKSSLLSSLESLNILSLQDGEKIVLDDVEVA